MSEIKLDWASAEVDEGKLTVDVEASAPSGWRASFERSVKLLHGGGGDWGEVKLKKKTVSVGDVSPGSEDKLRHFLEGVVQQVNANYEEPDEAAAGDADDGKQRDDGPDGKMTERFRSFAEEGSAQERDSA